MTADPALRAARDRGAAFADLLRPYTARLPLLPFLVAGIGADRFRPPRRRWHRSHPVRLRPGRRLQRRARRRHRPGEPPRPTAGHRRPHHRRRPQGDGCLRGRRRRGPVLLDQPRGLVVTAPRGRQRRLPPPPHRAGAEGPGGHGLLAATYLVLPVLLSGRPVAPVVLAAMVLGGTATLLYKDVKDEAGDGCTASARRWCAGASTGWMPSLRSSASPPSSSACSPPAPAGGRSPAGRVGHRGRHGRHPPPSGPPAPGQSPPDRPRAGGDVLDLRPSSSLL